MSVVKQNSVMDAILKQYETNTSTSNSGSAKTYDLKNYFTTYLKDGLSKTTKTIRILGNKNGEGSPFQEVHVHSIEIDGQWKKFPCLKENFGKACPFCEAKNALYATKEEADKELAKTYNARKMYVLRVIDRDYEEDGVKFWRFFHNFKGDGIMDKLISIIKKRGDITDPITGRDISIDIGRDHLKKPIIQGIVDDDPAPISKDKDLAKSWVEDERTWEDVYSVKPYEYLEIIINGGVPMWDKDKNKFVNKTEETESEDKYDDEVTLGGDTKKEDSKIEPSVEILDNQSDDDDEDDLPF